MDEMLLGTDVTFYCFTRKDKTLYKPSNQTIKYKRILLVTLVCLLLVYSTYPLYANLGRKQEVEEPPPPHDLETNFEAAEAKQQFKRYDISLYDIALSEELQHFTYGAAKVYNIESYYTLILAVMQVESNYNPSAISHTNDYGLMQINICNHANLSSRLGLTDFLDPEQSIIAGVYMLSNYLPRYSVNDSLMCYNMGEGGAGKKWREGITTTNYVTKVLKAQQTIEASRIVD